MKNKKQTKNGSAKETSSEKKSGQMKSPGGNYFCTLHGQNPDPQHRRVLDVKKA